MTKFTGRAPRCARDDGIHVGPLQKLAMTLPSLRLAHIKKAAPKPELQSLA
jgi:hypothetical protein